MSKKTGVSCMLVLLVACLALMAACGGGDGGDSSEGIEKKLAWLADPKIRESLATARKGVNPTGHVQFADSSDIYIDEQDKAKQAKDGEGSSMNWGFGFGVMHALHEQYLGLYSSGLEWLAKYSGLDKTLDNALGIHKDSKVSEAMSLLNTMEVQLNTLIADNTSEIYSINHLASEVAGYEISNQKGKLQKDWAAISNNAEGNGKFTQAYNDLYDKVKDEASNYSAVNEITNCQFKDKFKNLDDTSDSSMLYLAEGYIERLLDTVNWSVLCSDLNTYMEDISTNTPGVNIVKNYYSYGSFMTKTLTQSSILLQKAYNIYTCAIMLNAYDNETYNYQDNATNLPDMFGQGDTSLHKIDFPIYNYVHSDAQFSEDDCVAAINQALLKLGANFNILYLNQVNENLATAGRFYNGDVFQFLENASPINLVTASYAEELKMKPLAYISNYNSDSCTDYFIADYFFPDANKDYAPWDTDVEGAITTHQLFLNHRSVYDQDECYLAMNNILYDSDLGGFSGTLDTGILFSMTPGFYDYQEDSAGVQQGFGSDKKGWVNSATYFQGGFGNFHNMEKEDNTGDFGSGSISSSGGGTTSGNMYIDGLFWVAGPGYLHPLQTGDHTTSAFTPFITPSGHVGFFNVTTHQTHGRTVMGHVDGTYSWTAVGIGDQGNAWSFGYDRSVLEYPWDNTSTWLNNPWYDNGASCALPGCSGGNVIYITLTNGTKALMDANIDKRYIADNYKVKVVNQWAGRMTVDGKSRVFSLAHTPKLGKNVYQGLITNPQTGTPVNASATFTFAPLDNSNTQFSATFLIPEQNIELNGTAQVQNITYKGKPVGGEKMVANGTIIDTSTNADLGTWEGEFSYTFVAND